MKNFKVVFAVIPALALTLFIYFSVNGFTAGDGSKVLNSDKRSERITSEKPNGIVFPVHLTNINGGHCLTCDYTYCIDGGGAIQAWGDFEVDLTCGQYHTICINSSQGCYGTWTGYIDCYATFPQIDIDLSDTPVQCLCS